MPIKNFKCPLNKNKTKTKPHYLRKMHGYPLFSFHIPISQTRIVIPWKNFLLRWSHTRGHVAATKNVFHTEVAGTCSGEMKQGQNHNTCTH